MEFGPVADLLAHEPADDPGTDDQGDGQGRQDRHDGAKHDVLVGVEVQLLAEEVTEIAKQVVNHCQCKDQNAKLQFKIQKFNILL